MTKTEIIAELRRSAAEDADPLLGVGTFAFQESNQWIVEPHAYKYNANNERMFFLLVACALESE